MLWCTLMVSCAERAAVRAATLASLEASDWGQEPRMVVDDGAGPPSLARILRTWTRAIELAAQCASDAVLLLEDDIRFAPHLRAMLERWQPLAHRGPLFFGTLYNVQIAFTQARTGRGFGVAIKEFCYGGQAIVLTPATARAILARWSDPRFAWPYPDERLYRIGGSLTEIFVHVPSLIAHVGVSTWNPVRELVPYPVGA